jgi:hypothetical protein
MPAPDETRAASTAELLRRIDSVTDVALGHLSVEDLLLELLERVQGLLGVDTAAVLLLDPSSEYLVATAAKGIEGEVHQGVRIPLGKGFALLATVQLAMFEPSLERMQLSRRAIFLR